MTAPKNFVAYRGPQFTIEWYYKEDGKLPDDLPSNEKDRAMRYQRDYETRIKNGEYYG